ncbi:uncharacterized protein [Primulina eburnea]|uniref:uncharacterized protein n=1 Tax=Primulina eburnea TaxID=1245227 RepID=UPI003C6C537A
MSSRNPISFVLYQNKIIGPNYHEWLRNLKIILNYEKIVYVLKKGPPKEAATNAPAEELRLFEEAEIAAEIYDYLQELYDEQTRPQVGGRDLVISNELSTDILLLSLSSSFDDFVVNFNINNLEAGLEEFFNMLTSYEGTIKKEKHVFFMGSSSGKKKGLKGKRKKHFSPSKKNKPSKKEVPNISKVPTKSDK